MDVHAPYLAPGNRPPLEEVPRVTGIRLGAHTPIPSHPRFGLTTFVKGVSIAYREVCGRLLSPFIYQLQPLTAISYPQKDEGFAAENAASSLGRNCKVCCQVLARLKSFSVQQSTKKEKGATKPAGFRAIVKSRLEMEEPLTDFSYRKDIPLLQKIILENRKVLIKLSFRVDLPFFFSFYILLRPNLRNSSNTSASVAVPGCHILLS